MPPRRTASEQLARFLTRLTHGALTGFGICIFAWLAIAFWLIYQNPEKMGSARIVGIVAVAGITGACPVVWLLARAWQHWLMVVLTELLPQIHGENTTSGINAAAPGNLRHLANTARR